MKSGKIINPQKEGMFQHFSEPSMRVAATISSLISQRLMLVSGCL
jgi:hypothetical protein